MKSLFVRLLVSMWLVMTILVGVFAVIHAWTFPKDASQRWRRLSARTTELRAVQALDCRRAGEDETCAEILEPLEDRDPRLAIYQDGVRIMGSDIEGAQPIEHLARTTGTPAVQSKDDVEISALPLKRPGELPAVVVATQRKPSPWMFFIGPDTLPFRLLAIVVVTGLVAFALARWLSRPVRALRTAARRLGAGDLTVRVSPELGGADEETLALGQEMDRMAERIAALLEGQRRLLRDVSHELRSPLARLNIALELLRRKAGPDAADTLARIEREAARLDAMIGELLTLSRLEAGEDVESPEPVELRALVDEVAADADLEAQQKSARVVVADGPDAAVRGSRELLRRAIENIVRNAARYTEPSTEVEVALRSVDGEIVLTVRDHGPGVPAESLSKIFQPFYRVGDDRARNSGGAGIGLAIAERAIALHGGTVAAENASGGGLIVTLRLPSSSPS